MKLVSIAKEDIDVFIAKSTDPQLLKKYNKKVRIRCESNDFNDFRVYCDYCEHFNHEEECDYEIIHHQKCVYEKDIEGDYERDYVGCYFEKRFILLSEFPIILDGVCEECGDTNLLISIDGQEVDFYDFLRNIFDDNPWIGLFISLGSSWSEFKKLIQKPLDYKEAFDLISEKYVDNIGVSFGMRTAYWDALVTLYFAENPLEDIDGYSEATQKIANNIRQRFNIEDLSDIAPLSCEQVLCWLIQEFRCEKSIQKKLALAHAIYHYIVGNDCW